MSNLIINADDFGLTTGVNRAIAELHAAGALTSATLMACGAAFQDAVQIARQNPELGVGCHIVLVDGTPSAPVQEVSSLLEPGTNRFYNSLGKFLVALHTGRIQSRHIEREAFAQIQTLQAAQIHPTHVDTHKHTHLFPRVTQPILRAAVACGVKVIRNPMEPGWSAKIAKNAFKRRLEVTLLRTMQSRFFAHPQIASGEVATTQGCLGVSATGSLDQETLAALLRSMPEGTWELVTHPGYNDADLHAIKTRLRETREVERKALIQQIPTCAAKRITFAQIRTQA